MWRLLLLRPFVAVSMLAAAGKDREKEQRAQSLFSHHAISAPHPPPPREMLYADLKVVSGVYEVEVRSLLAHSTWWKALEGDPLKPAAQGRAREQMRFNVHTPLLLHQMIHFV